MYVVTANALAIERWTVLLRNGRFRIYRIVGWAVSRRSLLAPSGVLGPPVTGGEPLVFDDVRCELVSLSSWEAGDDGMLFFESWTGAMNWIRDRAGEAEESDGSETSGD